MTTSRYVQHYNKVSCGVEEETRDQEKVDWLVNAAQLTVSGPTTTCLRWASSIQRKLFCPLRSFPGVPLVYTKNMRDVGRISSEAC